MYPPTQLTKTGICPLVDSKEVSQPFHSDVSLQGLRCERMPVLVFSFLSTLFWQQGWVRGKVLCTSTVWLPKKGIRCASHECAPLVVVFTPKTLFSATCWTGGLYTPPFERVCPATLLHGVAIKRYTPQNYPVFLVTNMPFTAFPQIPFFGRIDSNCEILC